MDSIVIMVALGCQRLRPLLEERGASVLALIGQDPFILFFPSSVPPRVEWTLPQL